MKFTAEQRAKIEQYKQALNEGTAQVPADPQEGLLYITARTELDRSQPGTLAEDFFKQYERQLHG